MSDPNVPLPGRRLNFATVSEAEMAALLNLAGYALDALGGSTDGATEYERWSAWLDRMRADRGEPDQ